MSNLSEHLKSDKNSSQKWIWIFHGSLVCVAVVLTIFLFRKTDKFIANDLKPNIKKIKNLASNIRGYKLSSSSLGKGYKKLEHGKLNFKVDFPSSWKFYTAERSNAYHLSLHPKNSSPNFFNPKYLQIDILDVSRYKNMNNLQELVKASVQNVHGADHDRGIKFTSKAKTIKVFKNFEAVEFSASWISQNKQDRIFMRSFVLMDNGVKKSVTIRSFYRKKLYSKELEKMLSTLTINETLAH